MILCVRFRFRSSLRHKQPHCSCFHSSTAPMLFTTCYHHDSSSLWAAATRVWKNLPRKWPGNSTLRFRPAALYRTCLLLTVTACSRPGPCLLSAYVLLARRMCIRVLCGLQPEGSYTYTRTHKHIHIYVHTSNPARHGHAFNLYPAPRDHQDAAVCTGNGCGMMCVRYA